MLAGAGLGNLGHSGSGEGAVFFFFFFWGLFVGGVALDSRWVAKGAEEWGGGGGGGGGNLRGLLQQVGENMQNNGVSVQDLIQQAREGTLNQQSLIDQGVVSQDMIDNMRNQAQNYQQQRNGQGRLNPTTLQA